MKQKKAVLGIGWDVGGWMGKKQGVAVARLEPGTSHIEWLGRPTSFRLPAGRLISPSDLLHCARVDASLLDEHNVVIAIDAPLGFPAEFCSFLSGWPFSETNAIAVSGRAGREIDSHLAYRETERYVHTVLGKKPLSATFDKLGNNATVALSHVQQWREKHGFVVHPMDVVQGGDRHVIEVYPALLKEKKDGQKGERLQALFHHLLADLDSSVVEGTDEHDAAICAALAVCFAGGGVKGLPKLVGPDGIEEIDLTAVGREGWIYYPESSAT